MSTEARKVHPFCERGLVFWEDGPASRRVNGRRGHALSGVLVEGGSPKKVGEGYLERLFYETETWNSA